MAEVIRYKKGQSTPDGNTEFPFQTGDLNFHSTSYDWLLINQGGKGALFKGEGTVNGAMCDVGPYQFTLWAGDDDPDTFRIRIWCEDSEGAEDVLYDNKVNEGPDQAIAGGSIVIHTKK